MPDINLKVIDISHHNRGPKGGPIDFAALREFGVMGVIHKSSQGTGMKDTFYAKRRADAVAAGMLWGSYHFATAAPPEAQVEHWLATAEPEPDTLMALDHEPNRGDQLSLTGARRFLEIARERLGRQAVLYSGNLIKEQLRGADEFFGSHRLWLAQYGPVPKVPLAWKASGCWLWQFSGDGVNNPGIRLPGIQASMASKLDMNSFGGTDEALAAEWAA